MAVALALVCTAAGCEESSPTSDPHAVRVTWTAEGVPHVHASTLGGVGYGQGWAFARLNACVLADQVLKVQGERAAHLGPGENNEHVRSDLVYRFLDHTSRGLQAWDRQPPEVRELVEGYAAGYNDAIEQHRDELPCADASWLRPLDPPTLFAYYSDLATVAGERQLHDAIVDAQPPGEEAVPGPPHRSLESRLGSIPGSNGWALGRDRTTDGTSITVANPHFPWSGEFRLFESHLTAPGLIDAYGVSLMGVPGITIGFNAEVSWTHTFARGNHFLLYVLELDPSDPTRYIIDGESRAMTSTDVTIDVLQPDGTLQPQSLPMWTSEFGPIVAIPELGGWTDDRVFAIYDVNANNDRLLEQFLGMATADSLEAFQDVFARVQGIPWVHTMAAGRDGRVWYSDASAIPSLSEETLDEVESQPNPIFAILRAFGAFGVPGTSQRFLPQDEPTATRPGVIAFDRAPSLERTDFVYNSNDSHWLANPSAPLEGFSPLYGTERQPIRPRTRMNMVTLLEGEHGGAGADGLFTFDEARDAMLSNAGVIEQELRADVVSACRSAQAGEVCDVLEAWDGMVDLDSRGALLWREFLGAFDPYEINTRSTLFAESFDADDPVHTPHGLGDADGVVEALVGAAETLEQAGIPIDAPLRSHQFVELGPDRHPMHGGSRGEGVLNLMIRDTLDSVVREGSLELDELNPNTHLSDQGYVFNYGSGFVMAVELREDGPRAQVILGYGQSAHADSPHAEDQVGALAEKTWRSVVLTEEDIAQHAASVDALRYLP